MPHHHQTPAKAPNQSDRALAGVFFLVLGLALCTALFASIHARGIFQDGVYYLYRMAEKQSFHLVDPARTTIQALRQAPIVLLTRYSELSLFARGQAFTFVMLILPALLCAACWWIAPAGRKGWIVFPLLHLTVGLSATSFNAVGEAGIATSFWWCLMFLLLFRTRAPVSQLAFVVLCVLAFRLHEGAFPLMLVLLLSCLVRILRSEGWRERSFLALAILLIAVILGHEVLWVVEPRVPAHRAMILNALANLDYLYHDGHLNLPLVTGLVGLVGLGGAMLIHWTDPGPSAAARARRLAFGFCAYCAAAAMISLLVEASFSPDSQVLARYHTVFVSFGLGLLMLALYAWRVPGRIWLQPAVLLMVAALSVAQATADIAATLRWRSYTADLQSRLTATKGLIRWEDTLVTGDPAKDINWKLMSMEWVIPLVCIVFATEGRVTTMIDPRPEMTFRPVDPSRPEQLPVVRGIDFSPFRATFAGK